MAKQPHNHRAKSVSGSVRKATGGGLTSLVLTGQHLSPAQSSFVTGSTRPVARMSGGSGRAVVSYHPANGVASFTGRRSDTSSATPTTVPVDPVARRIDE